MKLVIAAAIALAAAGAAGQAFAHHSFAMFDRTKTTTIDGTVKEFQFTNPHSWLEVNVPDAKGGMTQWSLEMNNLVGLRRAGWRAKTLNPGDKVKVSLHPMRDGSTAGQLMSVATADGRVLDGQGARPAAPNAANTQQPIVN